MHEFAGSSRKADNHFAELPEQVRSFQNHLIDLIGQIRRKTFPIKSDLGTVPHIRLSQEPACQSPIMK